MSLFNGQFKKKLQLNEEKVILDEQQALAVYTSSPKALVVAGAGSGKTRVLTERVKHLLASGVEPSNIVAITFTNMASEEMKSRLSDVSSIGDCFIGTIHSFANKIMKVSSDKPYTILNTEVSNGFYKELIEKYCKFLTFDRFLKYMDLKNAYDLGQVSEEQVDNALNPSELAEYMLISGSSAPNLAKLNSEDYPITIQDLCKQYNVINFNQLLKMATTYFKENNSEIEHLLIDEFQDIGNLEYNFFKSLKAKNVFYVGDDWQCQPKGSSVLMKDGTTKDISDIEVGDLVCGYDKEIGRFSKSGRYSKVGYEVYAKREFDYEGELITVTSANGNTSRYTPNHKTYVRINKDTEYNHILYLMKDLFGKFRIGVSTLYSKQDRGIFGLRQRMRDENCNDAWILKCFKTREEALVWEQAMSFKFQIPQVVFQGSKVFTEDAVNFIYSHIDNITLNSERCLKHFHRDIRYPLIQLNDNKHFTRNALVDIQSCNLIEDVMQVVEYNGVEPGGEVKDRRIYSTIKELQYEDIHDFIYCIEVEKVHNYVSDNILTCNSIYGFKGGNVNIMLNLANSGEFNVLPITTNYRNSKEVLDLASKIINQVNNKIHKKIIIPEDRTDGEVFIGTKKQLKDILELVIAPDQNLKDWFILVRTNKDLLEVQDLLSDMRIRNTSFRREGLSLSDLNNLMNYNSVKVLTVHTSKGLEAKNVILYGNFPVNVPKYRNNQEERKVMYVGITRAKETLVLLN